MALLDRFRGFFGRARPAPVPLLAAPQSMAQTMGEQLASAIGGWTLPKRGTWELLTAVSALPWLHGCVRRRAEAFAAVEWVLYSAPKGTRAARLEGMRSGQEIRHRALHDYVKRKELKQLLDHPLLDLLDEPMPGDGDVPAIHGPAWWELLSTWMDLVGEAPIGKDGPRTDDGMRIGPPDELAPVLPSWIASVPMVGRPYFEITMPSIRRVPSADLIWIRHLDPRNPYTGRGLSTSATLAAELETDQYMSAAARSRFFNGATPDFVLGVKSATPGTKPSKEALRELTAEIEAKHQGPDKAGRFHVLGGEFQLSQLGHTLVESQYIDGRKFLRDTCMQVFGVPPEVLGVLESSNKSTIAAAGDHFARYSTVPMCERFRAALQAELVTEYGDDSLILDYVSPVPADGDRKTRLMVALPAAFTINDIRAEAGKAPRPDGDEYYKAPGAVPTKDVGSPGGDGGDGDGKEKVQNADA